MVQKINKKVNKISTNNRKVRYQKSKILQLVLYNWPNLSNTQKRKTQEFDTSSRKQDPGNGQRIPVNSN